MSIQAVIWDLGGVLVRTEDGAPRAALAAKLGLSRLELEKEMFESPLSTDGMLGRISGTEHYKSLGRQFSMDSASLVKWFFAGDQLDEKLIAFIRGLRPKYTTALLSNAFSTLRRYIEEEWRIADAFNYIFISAELGLAKPDAAIYRHALERMSLSPEAAVFIDDFAENITAAEKLGMQAIQFKNREQIISTLQKLLGTK